MRKTAKDRKISRQRIAIENLEARNARSDTEQLKRLDKMFGEDKGAKKERAKLKARMSK